MRRAEKRCRTVSRAAAPSRPRRASSRASRPIAAASRSGRFTSTSRPLSSSAMTSGMPPTAVETTGSAAAIASRSATGMPSV